MPRPIIGACTLELYLPGLNSLKEKRSILKSLLQRLHKTFSVSTAEIDYQDHWQSAKICIVTVSNSQRHTNQVLSTALMWIESNYPDIEIVHQEVEIL